MQVFDRTYHTDAHKQIHTALCERVFTVPLSLLLNGLVALCSARSEHSSVRRASSRSPVAMDSPNASENRLFIISDEDHRGIILVVSIICCIYVPMVLTLRGIVTRRDLGWDDWFAIAASVRTHSTPPPLHGLTPPIVSLPACWNTSWSLFLSHMVWDDHISRFQNPMPVQLAT